MTMAVYVSNWEFEKEKIWDKHWDSIPYELLYVQKHGSTFLGDVSKL